jgi:hypothetical protein
MARTIIPPRAAGMRLDGSQGESGDKFPDKLLKYVPAETLAFFVPISASLGAEVWRRGLPATRSAKLSVSQLSGATSSSSDTGSSIRLPEVRREVGNLAVGLGRRGSRASWLLVYRSPDAPRGEKHFCHERAQ